MALKYKMDVLAELRLRGYNSTRLRREKQLSQYTIQSIRKGIGISWSSLEQICALLECQPGDILEYEKE